jgi:HSP20 family protein
MANTEMTKGNGGRIQRPTDIFSSLHHDTAERSYGVFERTLRMPDTIDESKLEAKFDKGVLKIVAQKESEATETEKRIEIRNS